MRAVARRFIAIFCLTCAPALSAEAPATTPAIDAARLQKARDYVNLALPLLGDQPLVPAITLNDLAQVQAALGDFTQARASAQRNGALSMRIESLASIATRQWRAGDHERARETFAEGFRLALSVKSGDPNPAATGGVQSSLYTVGYAQLDAGDADGAQHTLDEMTRTSVKVLLLKDVGEIAAKTGNSAKARRCFAECYVLLDAVLEAGHETSPDLTAADIALSQARSGDVTGAKLAVKRIGNTEHQAAALASIALYELDEGDFGSAIHTLDGSAVALLVWLGQREHVDQAFSELVGNMALARAKLGDAPASTICFRRAIAAATTLDGEKGATALTDLGYQQKEAGDVPGSVETLRQAINRALSMKDAVAAVHAVWEIAIKQASHRDEAGALSTIQLNMPAGDMGPIDTAFEAGGLAREQTRWNGTRAQLDWIEKLPTPGERCYVYAQAAAGLVEPHE